MINAEVAAQFLTFVIVFFSVLEAREVLVDWSRQLF